MFEEAKLYKLLGRTRGLLASDICELEEKLTTEVMHSRFLVIGGAGTIGKAVTREIFRRSPASLHVVDISENNLVELVRDIRSTFGYIEGDFQTFALDSGSVEFSALMNAGEGYDYVLNLSALKHVRSEKDPYTLMRMIEVNIFNTLSTVEIFKGELKNYFCVSTDKAANPVNMMGATKRIMELFLMQKSFTQSISMARFANVAFSDGSLLHGFQQRFQLRQPLSAPRDVKRYFITSREAGELCLIASILGDNRDIFFPKLDDELHLTSFVDIASRFVSELGFQPYICDTEEQARIKAESLIGKGLWPCYFFDSDTTGEKPFEEFYTDLERPDFTRFKSLGVVPNTAMADADLLENFEQSYRKLRQSGAWSRTSLVDLLKSVLPDLVHLETGKFLDQRM
jgi:FlaA1/EpsC-like NDP-sugar epimerase